MHDGVGFVDESLPVLALLVGDGGPGLVEGKRVTQHCLEELQHNLCMMWHCMGHRESSVRIKSSI